MKNTFILFFLFINSFLFAQSVDLEAFKQMRIRSIGPAGMSGRITAIDVNLSNDAEIYAGAASGGVWRSRTGGIDWEPIFDKEATQSIGAIKINQHNSAEIWVGTGEGNPRNSLNSGRGIYKSIDAGKTWKCMGLENTKTIHRIIINKDNSDIVLVAALGSAWGANDDRGVFKTTDGGKTWRKILYINNLTGCADMVVDPTNPNKIIAAMWEHQRKPWNMQSGGKGSGLYITYDGGEHWERKTEKDGLPKGDLGRIGMAFSQSKPNVMYAIVEAKDNAFYRSDDAGSTWKKVSEKDFGNRPFYYSEIYVDPKNENRVYSIYSVISRSEDGGKNWETLVPYNGVHPDHHALWIHPDKPDFMINGNDGGLNITHDGGKTWRFAENIPVGQFYHVNIDNAVPYNLYGGLQDNGSWVGPSNVWRNGGIRNSDWQELYFGDGFDVAPRTDDNRFVFAMSQGGNIAQVDKLTGNNVFIQPQHPQNTKLRYNWNAGFSIDPFQPKGLYYGSQFLHRSKDAGQNWEIISPDLTTNDTTKQHPELSGGLTPDATNAENHCTILAIAPSPLDQNVVWVGTDDGNVQLTRDGGKTWENFAAKLPNCPKNAWIPQIEVSTKNAGEAFVVVNNYRMNDWSPYLYHTRDYGKTWKRLVSEKSGVDSYVMSVVQDLVEPNLLFLGTDTGLYVSFDYGTTWTKWKAFPSVNVSDMKIHPREHDLVLATFGRAFHIMDNILPLREIAKTKTEVLKKPFKVFATPDAYLAEYASYQGVRFNANAMFEGEVKNPCAHLTIWIKTPKEAENKASDKKKEAKKEDKDIKKEDKKEDKKDDEKKVTIYVTNLKGDTIRTLKESVIDTGLNQINWYLEQKTVNFPSREASKNEDEQGGLSVLPGQYKLYVTYLKSKDSTLVNVLQDPRMTYVSINDLSARETAVRDFSKVVKRASEGMDKVREMRKVVKLVEAQFVNVPDSLKKDVLKIGKNLQDSLDVIEFAYFGAKDLKGINRNSDDLQSKLYGAAGFVSGGNSKPSINGLIPIQVVIGETDKIIGRINKLLNTQFVDYQQKAEAIKYSLFKKIEPVR